MAKQIEQLGPEYRNVSLSHGTMLADDLFEAFREFLPDDMIEEYLALPTPDDVPYGAPNAYARDEFMSEVIWEHMMRIAPEGCGFGSSEGDGADFGFWSDDEGDDE